MYKFQQNITEIEQKFKSLKTAQQLYSQPTPISQVIQIITAGVIKEKDVHDFIKYVHSDPNVKPEQKINQMWYELELPQIVQILDKVMAHKNNQKQKQKQTTIQINSNLTSKKNKIKAPTSQAHQNPYVPVKITAAIKKSIDQSPNSTEKTIENKLSSPIIVKQELKQGYYNFLLHRKSKSLKESSEPITKQVLFGLPVDFQKLPPKERYAVLSKKYGKDKKVLQKRFDSIYKHYRKEMFIPFECFQINNQLLMDLRIFLKYYRQFDISKRFKTNQAILHFKKLALNGLWLDDKKFIEVHYKLVDLLEIDQNDIELQVQATSEKVNEQKVNQLKIQHFSKKIKNLVQNILSIKELSDLISEAKTQQRLFNTKQNKSLVKRIVQAHSGLIKYDVMLKLQERVEMRKSRKNTLLQKINKQKFSQQTPSKKNSSDKKAIDGTNQRLSPKNRSIYEQLEIPKLRSRQLKKSSVYSSMEMVDIEKQKQRLKQLIKDRQNQQYLNAFFKKQRTIFSLTRSKSVALTRDSAQNQQGANIFSTDRTKSTKYRTNNSIIIQRNFSLPRMRFT